MASVTLHCVVRLFGPSVPELWRLPSIICLSPFSHFYPEFPCNVPQFLVQTDSKVATAQYTSRQAQPYTISTCHNPANEQSLTLFYRAGCLACSL